jgi:hypothetical protein
MTTPTGPTITLLTPQTLCDLLALGIGNATWLQQIRKIKGLNKTEPFYTCKEFWRSPFEIEFRVKDRIGTIDFTNLGNAILTVAEKYPEIVATFEKGNFSARQADTFTRLLFLGDRYGT